MTAQDRFKELINSLKPFFKSNNYLKKGSSFYCLKEGNYGLIAFQKSVSSNASQVVFTINMGIYSQLLAHFFAPERSKLQASLGDCHWTDRVKEHLAPFNEKWWRIDAKVSVLELSEEVQNHLKKSMAVIEHYISNKKQQSLWLSGKSPGIIPLHRLMYLSVLLKDSGDNRLESVKDELIKASEGTASAFIVQQHLSSL